MILELKKTLFFGYSRESVHFKMNELEQAQHELERELREQKRLVAELTAQLRSSKDKEDFVADALIQARQAATTMLEEARLNSQQYIREVTTTVNKKVEQAEGKLNDIDEVNNQLVSMQMAFKNELKNTLETQLKTLDALDLTDLKVNEDVLQSYVKQGHDILKTTRKIIEFPDASEKKNGDDDVIPLFVLENS